MKRVRVHRLVGVYFIDNPDNKPFINHKDGVKTNNNFNNLEWCTQKENVKHAIDNNLTDGKNGAILNQPKVRLIKRMLSNNIKQKTIAKLFNVSRGTITDINIEKTWKTI